MKNIESNTGEIVMYQPDETIRLEVRMEGETVWLSANQMSLLFDRDEKTIRKHINNVFSDNEVPKAINTHFLRVDGVKQPVTFYTLDVIISVGYRVKSKKGTAFRQWAQIGQSVNKKGTFQYIGPADTKCTKGAGNMYHGGDRRICDQVNLSETV